MLCKSKLFSAVGRIPRASADLSELVNGLSGNKFNPYAAFQGFNLRWQVDRR